MFAKFKNPALLRFLGAVQHHSETTSTLLAASGYDPLELQVAVAAAQDLGLVEATGKIHPSLRITNAGRAWAAAELAPLVGLLPVTDLSGRAM